LPSDTAHRAESTPIRAYAVIVVAIVATSSAAILIRLALDENMPPLLIAGARLLIATAALTPIIFRRYQTRIRRLTRVELKLVALAGLCLAIHFTAWVTSLQYTTVLVSVVIVSTGPIWVAILEVAILKVKLKGSVWLGVFVALAGAMLISWATSGEAPPLEGGNPSLGIIMALISACSASLYIIIGRKVRGSVSFVPYIWLVYTSGAVTTLLIIASSRTPVLGYEWQGYLWVLLLAVLAQIIGHGVLNFVLRYLSPTTLTVTAQTVPVLSALWALLILSETPTMTQVAGSIVLVLGVGIVLRAQNRAKIRSS